MYGDQIKINMTVADFESKEESTVSNSEPLVFPQEAGPSNSKQSTFHQSTKTLKFAKPVKRRRASDGYYSNDDYSSSEESKYHHEFTPEEQKALKKKEERIEKIEGEIKRMNEKIERADDCIMMFARWPELIVNLGKLATKYGEQALKDLEKKLNDEEMHEKEPVKAFTLLFNFYRGREDTNNFIKSIIHERVSILREKRMKTLL